MQRAQASRSRANNACDPDKGAAACALRLTICRAVLYTVAAKESVFMVRKIDFQQAGQILAEKKNAVLLDVREDDWAVGKTAEELTPYISKAVSMLREAGLPVSGVTSTWYFGIKNETEYVKAISESFRQVCGRNECWYFCRGRRGEPNALPWVALSEGDRRVVSIPATTSDHIWQTMDTTETSDEYISKIADLMITADGSNGEVIDVLESGGWPVLIAHWQSLFSNGLGTGLRVLGEVGRRIEKNLTGRVEWMSFEQIMKKVLEEPDRYPAPDFS
jgi:hypothetical protein